MSAGIAASERLEGDSRSRGGDDAEGTFWLMWPASAAGPMS